MTALAADRDTPRRESRRFKMAHAASVTVFRGALVVLDPATGKIKPGVAATGLIAAGRAETGTADDPDYVEFSRGVFRFGNSGSTDAITDKDWGATVYIVDDQTVAKTDGSGARSAAGICRGVDAAGVWVEI